MLGTVATSGGVQSGAGISVSASLVPVVDFVGLFLGDGSVSTSCS